MQPKFLALRRDEYVFVPVPNANVTFRNNLKILDIDYPWVFVESLPQAGADPPPPPVWVNMEQVAVVKVIPAPANTGM